MPELPDLVYIESKLSHILPDRSIVQVRVKEPIVLRVMVQGDFAESLTGKTFAKIVRHGPFLNFQLSDGLELVVHPMLAGKFKHGKQLPSGRGLCFTLSLDNGNHFAYLDDKKMGKVYLIRSGDYANIPRYLQQGVNIISDEFTWERFLELIKGQRKQVRVFLMDQTLLSAIGNAYADEILYDARLYPKTLCSQLSDDEKKRLYESIRTIMHWGIKEVEVAAQPLDVKVRKHVKVRNRKDNPCPRCGTTIRRAGVLGYDTFFCPVCQPSKRNDFIKWS